MGSRLRCDNGHPSTGCRQAAAALAATGIPPFCGRRGCNAAVRYIVSHSYPGKDDAQYELVHVARWWDDVRAEREAYDPMLLVLRDQHTGSEYLWPFYWTKNRHQRRHVGQFPPILSAAEFASLLAKLPLRLMKASIPASEPVR